MLYLSFNFSVLREHLTPINIREIIDVDLLSSNQLGNTVTFYERQFPDLTNFDIALVGVQEDRGAMKNVGCRMAPNKIRKFFYRLFDWQEGSKIIDLGNINNSLSKEETYEKLASVVKGLKETNTVAVILGGSNDLLYAMCQAYENQHINLVSVDEQFDFQLSDTVNHSDSTVLSSNLLQHIIADKSIHLNNYSLIGYQTHLSNPAVVNTIERNYFEAYRLGNVRENLEEVEPIFRDADVIGVDVSAVKQSDAPGNKNASPNGFYAEEICRMMRYAGISNKVSSLGLFEFNPDFDKNNQTAQLFAQMVWYFASGYYARKTGDPLSTPNKFVKYLVTAKETELKFWKHEANEKWWLEMPHKEGGETKFIACSYTDYQIALNGELPDRWLMALHKLSYA